MGLMLRMQPPLETYINPLIYKVITNVSYLTLCKFALLCFYVLVGLVAPELTPVEIV